MRVLVEDTGMDTVFRVLNEDRTDERYLLEDWGEATPEATRAWAAAL